MKVLHFTEVDPGIVRIQRYLQNSIDMGIEPVVLCKGPGKGERTQRNVPWIPDFEKVIVECYPRSHMLSYCLPIRDEIGLRKVFEKHECDLVHAHNLAAAYYSYTQGLPTVFDDWEYHLEYLNYRKESIANSGVRRAMTSFLVFLKKRRAGRIVLRLIRNVPVIVTNRAVEEKYRELGASWIWSIPNVPLSYEREHSFAVDVKKRESRATCYIGSMTKDSKTLLRNTSGVIRVWRDRHLGDLFVFDGDNWTPHLQVMRRVREFHLNLLFWKPLPVHRYYLQNKAFLASVVGVPTIISSSLKSTIELLGEYAIPVDSLEDIPDTVRDHDQTRKYSLHKEHLWEYYSPYVKEAYDTCLAS